MEPLAQRLRPRSLDEVCGQQHLLGKNQVFRRTVESGKIPNMIFYGPSGVGKTTVASIIAAGSGMQLHKLNGTTASTSDIKSVLADIGTLGAAGGILLYLDEIQYFNKRQQQSLLECVEQGTVTLIASTTENPYFYVYNALLSRCTVFEFKSLTADDIRVGLQNAAARLGAEDKTPILIPDDALDYLAQSAGGDMRKALGNLEFAVTAAPIENGSRTITLDMVQQVAVRTAMRYDKLGDDHYDIVSAYQKSMRGSDPDAALHYLGRLLEAGDLPSACRRLMVCACEDVGLAWPQIIPIVKAAVDIANAVGLPEARLPLADAVVLVATVRALKMHGGVPKTELKTPNVTAVKAGLPNLGKHIENIFKFGLPVVVAINVFEQDTEEELKAVYDYCADLGVNVAISDVFAKGGAGGVALAEEVVKLAESGMARFKPLYPLEMPLQEKVATIVKEIYGGDKVEFAPKAAQALAQYEAEGFGDLPVCMAKTQNSLSDDPALLGAPSGFTVHVKNAKISAGAGFIVIYTGDIMTMPGLPKKPAAENIDVTDEGLISGLF